MTAFSRSAVLVYFLNQNSDVIQRGVPPHHYSFPSFPSLAPVVESLWTSNRTSLAHVVENLCTRNWNDECRPALVAINNLHKPGDVVLFYALPTGPVKIKRHLSSMGGCGIPCLRAEGSPLAIVASVFGPVTMYYFRAENGNRLPRLAIIVLQGRRLADDRREGDFTNR